jgi:hypothetical protein
MRAMSEKMPKSGTAVQIFVGADVYCGLAFRFNRTLILTGFYDGQNPLKGCDRTGRFTPMNHRCFEFPSKDVPASKQFWKTIDFAPKREGQYFIYIKEQLTPLTIVSLKTISKRKATTLFCSINGTHSFAAPDFASIHERLQIDVIPEYKNDLYNDMVSILSKKLQVSAFMAALS